MHPKVLKDNLGQIGTKGQLKVNKIGLLWNRIEDKIYITRYNNVVDKIYILGLL